MSAHARIGPSSLSRVRLCPGSVKATEGLPNPTTEAAAEGSLLHEIAAECLEYGFEPWDYAGRTVIYAGHTFKLGDGAGETDPECMVDVIDWIREQPGKLFIEQKVSLDPWMPGQFGTMDVGIYTPDVAVVCDFKFGWVVVDLLDNEQLLAYALGFLMLLRALGYKDPKRFRLMIEQPRPQNGSRYFEPWEVSIEDLLAFSKTLEAIWAAANDPDAPRVAGPKQCFYCVAKDQPGGCYAHSQYLLDMADLAFEDLDDDEADVRLPGEAAGPVITPERRAWIVFRRQMFVRWLKDLAAQTLGDALSGLPTPSMKAIDGEDGNREWIDEAQVQAILEPLLGPKSFTMKLISPASVDKVFKTTRKNPGNPEALKKLQALVRRPPGKPVLVSEKDPRPATLLADDKFDEEPEEI